MSNILDIKQFRVGREYMWDDEFNTRHILMCTKLEVTELGMFFVYFGYAPKLILTQKMLATTYKIYEVLQ